MSIYIIRSKDENITDCYIGSCKDFKVRKTKHKSNCYNENGLHYNYKLYKFIRANGGWDNFEMIEIGSVWDKATKSLVEIEQEYINIWKPTLNERRAYRTEEQKKEHDKRHNKEYYEKYRDILCVRKKEYWRENRDKYKEYYENNKDIINRKKKEPFACDCGSIVRKSDKQKHLKTNKHKNYISNSLNQS